MVSSLRSLTTLLMLAAALAGCSETLTPDQIAGTYDLTHWDGITIPAHHPDYVVLGGELELRADGTATLVTRVLPLDPPEAREVSQSGELVYELAGRGITLRSATWSGFPSMTYEGSVRGARLVLEGRSEVGHGPLLIYMQR